MTVLHRVLTAVVALGLATAAAAADKPAKLLLVTHSGGFVHDSVGTAEDVMKELGPKYGYEVTCFRYTGEVTPQNLEAYNKKFRGRAGRPVEPENCGRLNRATLDQFDVVFFMTTGDPCNAEEVRDLTEWVKAGGAFVGTHCATDTLYNSPSYGEMIGAYFKGHPAGLQDIRVKIEDPAHPAASGFTDEMPYKDEMYVFRDEPYDRSKLRIIFSARDLNPGNKLARDDEDYAISWCREYGKGKVFYTSFGHQKAVWLDPKFQAHLLGGIDWAVNRKPADATPQGKK